MFWTLCSPHLCSCSCAISLHCFQSCSVVSCSCSQSRHWWMFLILLVCLLLSILFLLKFPILLPLILFRMEFSIIFMAHDLDPGSVVLIDGLTELFLRSYEPELFPGLIYRMVKPRIVLLIFVSGKVVLTGRRRPGGLQLLINQPLDRWMGCHSVCFRCRCQRARRNLRSIREHLPHLERLPQAVMSPL